ncbi:FAD binding domain-containing protein [Purpureocillium lilacinum]|uniref:FAD binding domain-containing protein n=1 Tax=Purpureocillium lilacinum TaxID=33203 RepID=A0A179GTJ6_PURLI|nr:FAD binding domain-containing protein [Purpureocillium lilacinum]OAQ81267.1 FAD binding domain-containing protein [Purpureocillium lilacinum]
METPKHQYETDVLIVGAGPVGLFTAWLLAQLGQPCMLIEKSHTTTALPKMEYTNSRTAEIYRSVGLDRILRPLAVPEKHPFNEVWATGFGGHAISTWKRQSPTEDRKQAAEENDGTWAREPRIRQMQSVIEAELKRLCQSERLITDLWGYSVVNVEETDSAVWTTAHNDAGDAVVFKSRYVIGCDGAGSAVRASVGIQMERRSHPTKARYVHFKTPDADKLRAFGPFWHALFFGGAVVPQDEIDTYTVVEILPPDADLEPITDPEGFVAKILGGLTGKPFPVRIGTMLGTGSWKLYYGIADTFRSQKGRVFLAGDSAHTITPVCGFGFNSGVQDAFNLAWKLAAYLRGHGGDKLLESYNAERMPTVQLMVRTSEHVAQTYFVPMMSKAFTLGAEKINASGEDGDRARAELKVEVDKAFLMHDLEGVVLDYRYASSAINMSDPDGPEPEWNMRKVHPSTWPGCRAPHVFLSDGKTSIMDLYGSGFTLVDFSPSGTIGDLFVDTARSLAAPLKKLWLPEERHCRLIWERDAVLVRPDGFVTWRSQQQCSISPEEARSQ